MCWNSNRKIKDIKNQEQKKIILQSTKSNKITATKIKIAKREVKKILQISGIYYIILLVTK